MNLDNFPECTAALLTYTSPTHPKSRNRHVVCAPPGAAGAQIQLCRSGTRGFWFHICSLARQQWAFREELPITVLYKKNKAGGKKTKKKSFNGLSNVVVQSSQLEYSTSCLCIPELCAQNSFGVCDYCWSSWNFIKIPDRSGCIENLSLFWLDFGGL